MNGHVQLMVTYISLYGVTSPPALAIYRCMLNASTEGPIATV
jgi:hypothetical protein